MKSKRGDIFKKNREIIIAIIIGLSLLGYALINRQTKLETLELELQQERVNKIEEQTKIDELERSKNIKLSVCLAAAEDEYWESWKLNCSSDIVKDKDGEIESCSVYNSIGDGLEEQKQKDKDRCVDLYK